MFKIAEIKDPVFKIEFPSGTLGPEPIVKDFDPWKLSEDIESYYRENTADPKNVPDSVSYDAIRKAIGLSTRSEYDAADDPKPFLLSPQGCMELSFELGKYKEGLEISKKLLARAQNSPVSSAGTPK